ncbi:ATP synthase F1, gamma subunit [Mycoplasma haemocanis str. Illinois]|uniref:ATP synthase F1, gamma subunit n=1 Tax=Mycoplasma haemocanis (strain Illinois) TaxID=1111676 RepID=H6N5N3_MYCHN|nr:FoF1 ATP synthase subunit gamma [Mycoplasma haemocanis]AEW44993.1 ATP synthase F1, gamma subunit [Mycoplasma haemocanis str. Illinois]
MSNLPQINRKIKSTKTTSKITNALKVVSSNQSVAYRDLLKRSGPYLQGIYKLFFEIYHHPDHDIRTTNKHLIHYSPHANELWIILGTDIGMCGDFNDKIKRYMESVFDKETDGLIILGKKLILTFEKEYGERIEYQRNSEINMRNLEDSLSEISAKVFEIFFNKNYRRLTFVYLKDPKEGIIERVNILPFTEKYFVNKKRIYVKLLNSTFSYPQAVIDLFPLYLKCVLLGGIVTSKVSEHSSRRDLMHNATKNANELLDEYTLTFNKLRQANITQEITEIVVAVQSKKK